MKKLYGLVILLASVVIAGPAAAEHEWYGGISGGESDADSNAAALVSGLVAKGYDVTSATIDAEDSGWRFHVGLRFTSLFAVELGWVDLGEVNSSVTGNIAPTSAAQFTQDVADSLPVMPRGITLAAVARGTLASMGMQGPAAEKFSVAAKLGMIDADSERKVNGVRGKDEVEADPYYGFAVGWDFTPQWRGVLGFEVFNLADSTSYWSAGVEYRFAAGHQ